MKTTIDTRKVTSAACVNNGTFSMEVVVGVAHDDKYIGTVGIEGGPVKSRRLDLGVMGSRLYDYMLHISNVRANGGDKGDCFAFASYLANGTTPIVPPVGTASYGELQGRVRRRTTFGEVYLHLEDVDAEQHLYQAIHAMVGLGNGLVLAKWGAGDNEVGISTLRESIKCYGGIVYKVGYLSVG